MKKYRKKIDLKKYLWSNKSIILFIWNKLLYKEKNIQNLERR